MVYLLLCISLCINSTDTLRWEDFKGTPDSIEVSKGYRASTYTQWEIVDSFDDGRVWFTLESSFLHELSWTTTDCPVALSHEQTHVWISELWAAKCRKRLAKYQGCPESQTKKAHEIYKYCLKQSRKLQALFDREVRHGLNLQLELIWERNICRDVAKAIKKSGPIKTEPDHNY